MTKEEKRTVDEINAKAIVEIITYEIRATCSLFEEKALVNVVWLALKEFSKIVLKAQSDEDKLALVKKLAEMEMKNGIL